ncbi:MAG: T9SS type A sorting domain-containing protein [Flavobacteriales bacterium]|nr:T9SS type A sorting domain-containing protein [Flavobacteriales bacterium]
MITLRQAASFLVLSLSFSFTIQSQNVIESVNQRTDLVQFFDVLKDSDKNWIISGQANPGTNIPASLYFIQSVDSTGETIWDFDHDLMPKTWETAIPSNRDKAIVLPDGSVVLVGLQDGCDFITGISNLIKLTPSGLVEWSHEFGEMSEYNPDRFFDRLATNATTKIAIASSDTIMFFHSDGTFISKWEVENTPVRCMRWETDTTLLVAADSKVVRFGMDGAILDSVTLPNNSFGIDIHHTSSKVWIMTQDSIHVMDEQFQTISNINLSSLSGTRRDFREVDGAVWVTDKNGLWSISSGYELVNELMFSNQVVSSDIHDGVVMTVSTIEQNNRTTGLMKSYLMDGTSVEHADDVELLVHVDSIVTVTGFNSGPEPIFVHWAYLTPSIINHSQNVLSKVMVSYSEQYLPGFCGPGGVSLITENIELAYSDTLVLNFPPFRVGYYSPFTGDSTVTYSVCMVAQSPNDHLDVFPSDNIWCEDLNFVLPLGIQQPSISKLTVYPNPTTGIVNLPQIDNLKWQLFDATGRLVAKGNEEKQIDFSKLGVAEQVYSLRLLTNESQSIVKLIYLKQ